MKRVAFASFAGSAIEYYDFFLYGTGAALVFPTVFFPQMSAAMGSIASMAMFAVAFLARPAGAAVFGHFGDRLGRKRSLIVTLLTMGVSTVAVGLVPGQARIGVAAPIILLVLRLMQGFAVGGEWAGSALLSAEHAPNARRGSYGMSTQLGVGAAMVLTNLVFLAVNVTVGETNPAFLAWGWRIPFLCSALLIGVALYARLQIRETPLFVAAQAPRWPIVALLRKQARMALLASGSVLGGVTLIYIVSVYLMSYAHLQLGQTRNLCLVVGVLGGLALIASTAASARWCDTVGRRRLVLLGSGLSLPWSLAVMPLMDTGRPVLFGITVVVSDVLIGISFGPMGSFIPELFDTAHRYSGAAFVTTVGGIIGGAVPPMIAGLLLTEFGSNAIGVMMACAIVASLACAWRLPETMGTALSEPDAVLTPRSGIPSRLR